MNNEQELDQAAIDELLATANKELSGLDAPLAKLAGPQEPPITAELNAVLPAPQIVLPIKNNPLLLITAVKQHLTKKILIALFSLFVLVIGIGGFLGSKMADQHAQPFDTIEKASANSTTTPPQSRKDPPPSYPTKNLPTAALPAQIAEENRLTPGKVGFVQIGMTLADLQKKYPSLTVREKYVDGSKKAIANLSFNHQQKPSLELELSKGTLQLVSTISTADEQFATDKQITIKSTVGDIRNQYTINDVKVINHSLFLVVRSIKMLFELDLSKDFIPTEWLNTGNLTSIPADAKIKRIVLY